MSTNLAYYRNYNNFLKSQSGLDISQFSCILGQVKLLSQFVNYDEIKMPFVITGRLVSSGVYKDKNYGQIELSSEALKSSIDNWNGVMIYSSHAVYEKAMRGEDVSINEVLGKITKTTWNEKDPGIDFFAEIYDKQVAYKMSNGVIKYISVGFARDIVSKDKKYYFMNIEPKEASLVYAPRDKKAEFKPV